MDLVLAHLESESDVMKFDPEAESSGVPLAYLSSLSQIKIAQNSVTLDLLDINGKQAFGERIHLSSFDHV